jgi:altronate dehydratase
MRHMCPSTRILRPQQGRRHQHPGRKSLGCSRRAPALRLWVVLSYGEPVAKRAEPLAGAGQRPVASNALLFSGAHMVFFTRGGTPLAARCPL